MGHDDSLRQRMTPAERQAREAKQEVWQTAIARFLSAVYRMPREERIVYLQRITNMPGRDSPVSPDNSPNSTMRPGGD